MIAEPADRAILAGAPSLQAAADTLIDEANEAGGRDNITVVLFRVGDAGDAPTSSSRRGDGDRQARGRSPAQRRGRGRAPNRRAAGDRRRRPRATARAARRTAAPRPRRRDASRRSRGPRASAAAPGAARAHARRGIAVGAHRRVDRHLPVRRRRLSRQPAAVLPGDQRAGHGRPSTAASRTSCRSGSRCTRRSTSRACRHRSCPPTGARRCSTTISRSQSAATKLINELELGQVSG